MAKISLIEKMRQVLGDRSVNSLDMRRNSSKSKPSFSKQQLFFKRIILGFGLTSSLLAGISYAVYQDLSNHIQNDRLEIQRYKTLQELANLRDLEQRARIAKYRYLNTGDEKYLKPYYDAVERIDDAFDRLHDAIGNDPEQQQQLDLLSSLVAQKLDEIENAIDLYKTQGSAVALQSKLIAKGSTLGIEIDDLVEQLEEVEMATLTQQSRSSEVDTQFSTIAFTASILITFCVLAALYYQIHREQKNRKQVETILQQERDFTDSVIDTSGALVVVLDAEGKITRFNHACEQLLIYPLALIDDKFFWDLFSIPEEEELVRDLFKQFRGSDCAYQYESYLETPNGDRRAIAWSNTMLLAEDGTVDRIVCTGIDITDRKIVEEAMQRQLAAVEAAFDGIAILDRDRRYTYLNEAHAQIFGYKGAHELIGKTWEELYCPDEIERFKRQVFPILRRNKHWHGEATGKRKDGTTFPEETSLTLLSDGSLVCICNDISPRKRIAAELREQALALEYAIEGIARLDARGRYISVNQAYANLLGYTPEELLGKDWQITVHPDDRSDLLAAYDEMLAYGKVEAETRGLRKDGSVFHKRVTMVSSWDKDHNFNGHYCFAKDISDRKRLEAELQKQEEHFQVLVAYAPVGIFQTDERGHCLFVNQQWSELTGLSLKQAKGTGWIFALHPDDREDVFLEWDRCVQTGSEFSMEYRFQNGQGETKWVFGRASAFHNESGAIAGYFGTVTDITKRKQAEEQLKSSLQDKEVLLKEVHHRVKNNLQVIDSLFRHQCRHTKDENLVSILKECQNRVGSMALLHEKLYQSKDLANIDFAGYVQSLVANLFDSYSVNGNLPKLKLNVERILLDIETSLSCGLIINELVSNSLKYAFSDGRSGRIIIQFLEDKNSKIKLIFSDNGIGLPEEFDFEKTKTLGLKLVRSLVKQIEGDVKIVNDDGTKYIINFPRRKK